MLEKPEIHVGEKIIADLLAWLKIPIDNSTKDTPKRIAKMYVNELFSGLYTAPPEIKTFDGKEGYVGISDIGFVSMCEHHFLPFYGKCAVVYYTKGNVIGLSKVPRIVHYWSARPQLQERLCHDIASDIMKRLKPEGVYVAMSAIHSCMSIRGVQSKDTFTNTAVMMGKIERDEAIELLKTQTYLK